MMRSPQHPHKDLFQSPPTPGRYVSGSSNSEMSGDELIIISPEGVVAEHVLCFEFSTMNNEA